MRRGCRAIDGGAEERLGETIAGRRDDVSLVSEVLPSHATYDRTIKACRDSLKRLGTDRPTWTLTAVRPHDPEPDFVM